MVPLTKYTTTCGGPRSFPYPNPLKLGKGSRDSQYKTLDSLRPWLIPKDAWDRLLKRLGSLCADVGDPASKWASG